MFPTICHIYNLISKYDKAYLGSFCDITMRGKKPKRDASQIVYSVSYLLQPKSIMVNQEFDIAGL